MAFVRAAPDRIYATSQRALGRILRYASFRLGAKCDFAARAALGAKRIFGPIGTSHKGREAEIVEPANKATSQPKAANPLDKRVAIATEISACLGEYPRAG